MKCLIVALLCYFCLAIGDVGSQDAADAAAGGQAGTEADSDFCPDCTFRKPPRYGKRFDIAMANSKSARNRSGQRKSLLGTHLGPGVQSAPSRAPAISDAELRKLLAGDIAVKSQLIRLILSLTRQQLDEHFALATRRLRAISRDVDSVVRQNRIDGKLLDFFQGK